MFGHTDLGRKGQSVAGGRRAGVQRCPGPHAPSRHSGALQPSPERGLGKDPEGHMRGPALPNLSPAAHVWLTAAELSLRPSLRKVFMFPFPFYAEAEEGIRELIPMGWMLVKEGSVEEGPEIHREVQETKLKLFSFSQ